MFQRWSFSQKWVSTKLRVKVVGFDLYWSSWPRYGHETLV